MDKSSIAGIIMILIMGLMISCTSGALEDQDRALIKAADEGDLQKVQVLLKKGAHVNAVNSNGNTVLIVASGGGHLQVVQYLLDKGADINAKGRCAMTALMWTRDVDVARLLLDRGADMDTKDELFGETVLIAASKSGNLGLAQLLLDNRADINARANTGMMPLTAAAHNCNTEMVKLLLKKGADVNSRENCGESALFLASVNGCVETVRELLKKGANPNIEDNVGLTPLTAALIGDWIFIEHPRRETVGDSRVRCEMRMPKYSLKQEYTPDEELIKLLEAHGAR